jgi:signal transduction histidine kinase
MIEPIMFVAIGFLLAGLLVIGVIPLVHARAVRLTTRRLEALNPLSIAEIQADKDLLRAEFAMSTYRVEKRVEEIKAKATDHLTELGKKSEAIGRLKLELSEKTAALASTEAELAEVRAKLPRSFVTADKRSDLPRPKNSMRALLSVLEERRDPSKDAQLEQISDDRAGRAFRQVSMTRGH